MLSLNYDTRDVDADVYTEWAASDVAYALKRVAETRHHMANVLELGPRVCLAMDMEAMSGA